MTVLWLRSASVCVVIVAWLMACSSTALALSLIPESNEELAAAPRIVIADLISAQSRWNDTGNLILTDYRFQTIEILRGTFASEFLLTQGGGTVGEETHVISDLPVFRTGARYLLMLNENDNSGFSPVRYGPAGAIEVGISSGQLHASPQLSTTASEFRALVVRTPVIRDSQLMPASAGQNMPSKRYTPSVPSGTPEPSLSAVGISVPEASPAAEVPPSVSHVVNASPGQEVEMPASNSPEPPSYVVQSWPVPPITFNPLPHDWVWHPADQNMMAEWNKYGDIFRVFTTPTGTWGFGNDRYDLAGFPSNADLITHFGRSWGAGELAVTVSRVVGGRIVESDIAMNPNVSWTLDDIAATDSSSTPFSFRDTMLHELGHAWGLRHPWEHQNVSWPSVMNYSPKWARNTKLHSDDTAAIRSVYPGISIHDGSLEMYRTYEGGGSPFHNAVYQQQFAADSQYYHGQNFEFTGSVTLQNLGTSNLVNPLVEIYLTENRGSWGNTVAYLGSAQYSATAPPFPPAAHGLNLGYHSVPSSVPTGYYYPAIFLASTGATDQNINNNSSWATEGNDVLIRNVTQTLFPTGTAQYSQFGHIGPQGWWSLRFPAKPFQSYIFSTCGLADFDTVISIYPFEDVISSDDFCGLQSEILWHNGDYEGYVEIQVKGYNQAAQGSFQLMYKMFGDPEIEILPQSLDFVEEGSGVAETAMEAPIPDAALVEARQSALDNLMLEAQRTGSVRVIIGFEDSFQPEGVLGATEKQAQRLDIQDRALEIVASLSAFNAVENQRYQYIPFAALTVDGQALQQLAGNPMVTSIEEDSLAEPNLASSNGVIGSGVAWSAGYDGTGQTVAILDSGVDKSHPWFTNGGNKVVSEACYSSTFGTISTSFCPGGASSSIAPDSGINCSSNITGCDHGTHVAGIVAGNPGAGPNFGVARGASLIAVQVFSRFVDTSLCGSPVPCARSYTSDQIAGLERIYALRNDFNIAAVNMSLGGGRYYDKFSCDFLNPAIKAAISNLRSVKIATVIGAGNNGYRNSINAPGCISSAISVGATTDGDEVAGFSNMYQDLHFLAPGVSITSAVPSGAVGTWDGTSMSTPHVAGAWAVLKQQTPDADVSAILTRLQSSGTPLDDLRLSGNVFGIPRIDLGAAIADPSQRFKIFNHGGDPLVISDILMETPSPWISWAPQAPFTIEGGKWREVRVEIDYDSAPAGFSQRILTIDSNDLDESPYPGAVYVNVTTSNPPAAEFSSTPAAGATLDFGGQLVATESAALSIEVENLGDLGLTLDCQISGTDAPSFKLLACPTPIAVGESGDIALSCKPLAAGPKSAMLEVTSNDPDEAEVSFSLTCHGQTEEVFTDGFEG